MAPAFEPVTPALLAERLAGWADRRHPGSSPLRIGLDAPDCADLGALLAALPDALLAVNRPLVLVRASDFYRDASLRLEYGHTDVESFYSGWLDLGALRREVLHPIASDGRYLPSLRDPVSNRATRAQPQQLAGHGVLLLTGALLLGQGLPLDLSVHVAVSRQARKRLTPPALQWTLPALDRYDLEVQPSSIADAVVRWDDARHPAVRFQRD
ncbi:MAG TPA: hypothetical protein VHO01_07455 [Jatrophihabitans sp.]|nr:hypothetical protein [Jatrophihabitans sp.]